MRRWKSKVLLAKIETTYGQDPAPTGAADAILFRGNNVQLSPMEGEDVDRDLEMPTFGASEMIPVGLHQKLSFEVPLVGSGAAGTAPYYNVLLRGCGLAGTVVAGVSVTYNPITTGHQSVGFHFWVDGTRYVLLGSQGTCVFALDAKGLPVLRFTFWGLYQEATDVAQVTPSLGTQIARRHQAASSANTPTFTVNGVSLVLRSFELDLGVKVEPRMLVRREAILITDRAERIKAVVEAVPLATFNPYALARAATLMPLVLTHGTGAGNIVTLNAPTCQLMRQSGLEQTQDIVEWPLDLVPIPSAGNDQFTLAFS